MSSRDLSINSQVSLSRSQTYGMPHSHSPANACKYGQQKYGWEKEDLQIFDLWPGAGDLTPHCAMVPQQRLDTAARWNRTSCETGKRGSKQPKPECAMLG